MTYTHICTTDSLRAGIDEPAADCFICGKKPCLLIGAVNVAIPVELTRHGMVTWLVLYEAYADRPG